MHRVAIIMAAAALAAHTFANPQPTRLLGVNVLLNQPASEGILAELERHGRVLDVIPEINAVTLRAAESELPAVQARPYVVSATPDVECALTGLDPLPVADLCDGSSEWCLDAINVTDFGICRTVEYDGAGVYIAVIDTGLPYNWRSYFPEGRIATQFARGFMGGGGRAHAVSAAPYAWEHDTDGHGTSITSVILGFAYAGADPQLPPYFNGVAPRATVIPIRVGFDTAGFESGHWESVAAHAIVYAANLKISGALGDAPLIINLSSGISRPVPLERAAIDYAIENGVVVVAAAGNEAGAGMRYPAAYPEMISVAATCWLAQLPEDDPTTYRWILRDVPEGDVSQHVIAPFSSRELPGQELDLAAPGFPVPVPWTANGQADYTFAGGTSQATPHVAGVAALMLQKNPTLTQAQIETILATSALALPAGCADIRWPAIGPGDPPTWHDHSNVSVFQFTTCWNADATGAGLLQADAALAATPLP